jgi:SAM-dependent methyltransferase
MGRFASTVPFYARCREPFPPAFFFTVAESLALRRDMRLLDAGCGPGLLAIGFRPYVGSCVGVDPEPGMIRAAQAAASEAGVQVRLIEGRLEDLSETLETFDLVTIGRALHWMNRAGTLRVLDRVLAAGGAIISCGSKVEANPWLKAYEEIRSAWASDQDERRYQIDHDAWFAGSRFRVVDGITVRHHHRVTVDDLIGRALSKSNTSPETLGGRQHPFEAALTEVLKPFAADGFLDEEIVSVATVIRRVVSEHVPDPSLKA